MGRAAQFFTFHGRVGRQEYWLTGVLASIALFGGIVVTLELGSLGWVIAIPTTAFVAWMMLAMLVRRLHDRGRSGWWIVAMLGPVLLLNFASNTPSAVDQDASSYLRMLAWPFSLWILVDLGCLPGARGENRYGLPLQRPAAIAESFD